MVNVELAEAIMQVLWMGQHLTCSEARLDYGCAQGLFQVEPGVRDERGSSCQQRAQKVTKPLFFRQRRLK